MCLFHKWNLAEKEIISECLTEIRQRCKKCKKIRVITTISSHQFGDPTYFPFEESHTYDSYKGSMMVRTCLRCGIIDKQRLK